MKMMGQEGEAVIRIGSIEEAPEDQEKLLVGMTRRAEVSQHVGAPR